MEVASEAMITRNITNRAVENGKALIDLTENHGVKLWDTPVSYTHLTLPTKRIV